jgi:GNAT superfamily N-acetyltransferase
LSIETTRFTPDRRSALVALLDRVGATQLTDEEFAWWFDRHSAGPGIVSLALDGEEVVGVAAMSFVRAVLDGVETRLAIPLNVATDARYRGRGVFSTLVRENETAAAAAGCPVAVSFPNAASYPIFVSRLGWTGLPRLRIWARPLRASGVVRYLLGRPGARGSLRPDRAETTSLRGLELRPVKRFGPDFDELGRQAATRYGHHFVRDAEYFNWRYLDSPRDYRCVGAYRDGRLVGAVVVGHAFKHGISAGFVADLVAAPGAKEESRALLNRAVEEVKGGADVLLLLRPSSRSERRARLAAGFAPTSKRVRFIGKVLHEGATLDEQADAWHITLGDLDFF